MSKSLLIVRLARPRTWAFASVSYLFGYLATSTPQPWQIMLGVAIFSLGTAATNLTNVYTDIKEDSINLPARSEMVRELGRENLVCVILGLYALIPLLSLPFGFSFVLIVAMAEFDSIGYSVPPFRFKRHPTAALLSFSGAVSIPFLAGLVIAGSNLLNPLLFILASFMYAYGTVKNIPDILGDTQAGLKTTATLSTDLRRTVETNAVLLLTPYLLLSSMVALKLLSQVYLVNLIFLPFLLYWALGNIWASDRAMLEQLHTFGFVYAISFLLFNLLITYPSQLSLGISTFSYSFILLVTKYRVDSRLHPRTVYQEQGARLEGDRFGTHRN